MYGERIAVIISVICILLLGAGGWYLFSQKELPQPNPQPTNAPSAAEGLTITDSTIGVGDAAAPGDTLTVHYRGTLEDGTAFDNSYDRETPFTVTLGGGAVIKGWDLGLVGMKKGGKRTLVISPELAYGASGRGSIPPNATLTFEIELLSLEKKK